MQKEKVFLVKITDFIHSTQRISDKCAKIECSDILLHLMKSILMMLEKN